jgi:C1A family cysteine protease
MVRNSWGTGWGDQSSDATKGYWYLPYAVVDGASGSGASGDWPIYRDENYVYISSISHN